MAWCIRRHGGKVYVFYWDKEKGRQRSLPRKETRHLDGQPEHNVRTWMEEWEEKRGHKKPDLPAVRSTTYQNYVDDYVKYRREYKNRAYQTIQTDKYCLLHYILPYFVEVHGHEDPTRWPQAAPGLARYLIGLGVSPHMIDNCNSVARGFWRYLQEMMIIPPPQPDLMLPRPFRKQQDTPLKVALTPEDVLKFVRTRKRDDIKLQALLGYFFSLRTQEVLAVRPRDLRAGGAAADLECCRVMQRHGLYNRLAVYVSQQKTVEHKLVVAKAGSKGWVACFYEEAARLLVSLLNGLDPEEPLFSYGVSTMLTHWRKYAKEQLGVTPKDLRRASLYYLGHHTDLGHNLVALKSHARHRKAGVTELYLRRPGEVVEGPWQGLDLDDAEVVDFRPVKNR